MARRGSRVSYLRRQVAAVDVGGGCVTIEQPSARSVYICVKD